MNGLVDAQPQPMIAPLCKEGLVRFLLSRFQAEGSQFFVVPSGSVRSILFHPLRCPTVNVFFFPLISYSIPNPWVLRELESFLYCRKKPDLESQDSVPSKGPQDFLFSRLMGLSIERKRSMKFCPINNDESIFELKKYGIFEVHSML